MQVLLSASHEIKWAIYSPFFCDDYRGYLKIIVGTEIEVIFIA